MIAEYLSELEEDGKIVLNGANKSGTYLRAFPVPTFPYFFNFFAHNGNFLVILIMYK